MIVSLKTETLQIDFITHSLLFGGRLVVVGPQSRESPEF